MSLAPGTRLGAYEIVAAIGAGGMGEVYRARDTKLNRDVAIKVLPEAFAHDHERLARFTREAQTLASLNHPNIAAIHGIEEIPAVNGSGPGSRALVMELVEGEDLSQRIEGLRAKAQGCRSTRHGRSRSRSRRHWKRRTSRNHSPRSHAREPQSPRRRHGAGARLRVGESDGSG